MARTLPEDDQDWSDAQRQEEPPERVSLPAWGWLALAFVLAFYLRAPLASLLDGPALGTWTTIFVSISVQALPFLVLGVVLSGAIMALVPPGWLARTLPKRPLVAVPAAGLAGVVLPGCECGAVPIAGRLTARGAAPAAAFAFMLAAPAINPVVLVSTAVAFPGRPEMVAARFLASLATAVAVGLLWTRLGREDWIDRARHLRGRRHRPQGRHPRRPGAPRPRHLAGGRGTLAAADRRRPGPAILRRAAAAGRVHPGGHATVPAIRERLPLLTRAGCPSSR
jgi:uncharacterized membrane protein YraQ (UPF0718 family)